MKRVPRRRAAVPPALALVLVAAAAAAEDVVRFRGVELAPIEGRYVVSTDVNIRAGPKTESERLGSLGRGTRVDGVGLATGGGWMAVRRDGEDVGFVYAPVLLPLIDGTLAGPLEGRAEGLDAACEYTIRHLGRTPVEGEVLETSDYDVTFVCAGEAGAFAFRALMFITEAPYRLDRKPVYQVTVDVPQVAPGIDEVLSVTSLYRRDKETVAFDGAGPEGYARTPEAGRRPAARVAEALVGAVELAVAAWSEMAWRALAGEAPEAAAQVPVEPAAGPSSR